MAGPLIAGQAVLGIIVCSIYVSISTIWQVRLLDCMSLKESSVTTSYFCTLLCWVFIKILSTESYFAKILHHTVPT